MKGSEAEKHEYWKARGWTQCACDDPECGCWFDPQGEPQLGLPELPKQTAEEAARAIHKQFGDTLKFL